MTKDDWLGCSDPTPMLEFLRGKVSDRKLRLFICACCERIWPLRPDQRSRSLLDMAALRAEGTATDEMLRDALQTRPENVNSQPFNDGVCIAVAYMPVTEKYDTVAAASGSSWVLANSRSDYVRGDIYVTVRNANDVHHLTKEALVRGDYEGRCAFLLDVLKSVWLHERQSQVALLRDITDNVFDPVEVVPSWRTPTVVTLVENIYAAREFHRLPVLAAVLGDTGCDNQDIIGHCLTPGPHVRGCWVVDLLLGKE